MIDTSSRDGRVAHAHQLLLTSEGVPLELATAGLASRALARLLDLSISVVALYLVLVAAAAAGPPLWLMIVLITIGVFCSIFIYPVVMETMTRGRTVGKIATGLRVVTEVGGPVGFRQSSIRAALSVVDLLVTTGLLGMAALMGSPRNQRLGDLVAGTIVVRTRVAGAGESRTAHDLANAPAGFESFTAALDTNRLDEDEIAVAAALLRRRVALAAPAALEPQMRAWTNRIDGRLGGRRPEQMAAETFLRCVVAAAASTARPILPLVHRIA